MIILTFFHHFSITVVLGALFLTIIAMHNPRPSTQTSATTASLLSLLLLIAMINIEQQLIYYLYPMLNQSTNEDIVYRFLWHVGLFSVAAMASYYLVEYHHHKQLNFCMISQWVVAACAIKASTHLLAYGVWLKWQPPALTAPYLALLMVIDCLTAYGILVVTIWQALSIRLKNKLNKGLNHGQIAATKATPQQPQANIEGSS